MYYKKISYRQQLVPLFEELGSRVKRQKLKDIAQRAGLSDWQTGRLLSFSISSPNYLDMLKLTGALGMTPNEAAELVGMGPFGSEQDRRILALLHDERLSDAQREELVHFVEVVAAPLLQMQEAPAQDARVSLDLPLRTRTRRADLDTKREDVAVAAG